MSKHYPNHPPPYPNAPDSDANTFASWDHRQYAAPPGSVGGAPHYPQGAYGAPPTHGDGVGYPPHRGYAPHRPAHGDGVPYANHQGYQVPPQQPMYGDGVPYSQHHGHTPQAPHAGDMPGYGQQQAYAPSPPHAYPPPHGPYGTTPQAPAGGYSQAQSPPPAQPPPPAASSAPKAGEVHIQNRVASPKEAKEKRTSWFLIGLTAFFLLWVFAAALFIFNQMNIL